MKLSKQRLNKIKVRKEGTRKKKHLRKNKKKFDNSKKKNNRKSHLKNKTLKIYFGGANEDCQYKNIPFHKKFPEYFRKLSSFDKKNFITTYFLPTKNMNCLQEARDLLLKILQLFYKNTDPKPTNEQLVELKDIWEINLPPPESLPEDKRISYALNLNDIKSEEPKKAIPVQSEELRILNAAKNKKQFEEYCSTLKITPTLDKVIYNKEIIGISNNINANNQKNPPQSDLVAKIGNISLYRVETTSEGECMYSSFIYGLLLKQVGNWNKIPGWIPVKQEIGNKCNYMGNLRNVLANYICENQEKLLKLFEPNTLLESLKRINGNEWGQGEELRILAIMFGVCIAIFKGKKVEDLKTIKDHIEIYDKNGQLIQNNMLKSSCGEDIVYVIEFGNYHFQSVIPVKDSTVSSQLNSSKLSVQTDFKDNSKPIFSSTTPYDIPKTGLENIYPCSVKGINAELPDNEEDALKVLAKLDSILLHCNDESIEKFQEIFEFWEKYINNYQRKFGKQPNYISEHCQGIFKGDYDYNIVPENKDEALKKYNKLIEFIVEQELINDKSNCFGAANMALDIYIKNFKDKFGEDIFTKMIINQSQILEDCEYIFKNDMAPELVPNTKEAAITKLKQYEAILEKDKTEDESRCESQITDALNIYKTKMEQLYPRYTNEADTSTADTSTADTSTADASTADASTADASTADASTADASTADTSTADTSTADTSTADTSTADTSTADTSTADASTADASTADAREKTNLPEIIPNEKIEEIFNKIQKNDEINQVKLIKFLTNISDEDSILVRKVIGFDEPLTKSQIAEVRNLGNQDNWSKNAQIFNSLTKTYEQMQSGGGKNIQKGGYGEMNLEAFTKFINCGQYRDKSENTFDCKNVNIPDLSSKDFDSSSIPTEGTTAVDPENIKLEINEKQYSSNIKMVTVNMFVPNQSKVIVKNYAKNTEDDMTTSLPDKLPAPTSS
jgi:hypothetical protein